MIQCQFETGGKTHLRHVTIGVIVVKNKQILLGRRGTFAGKPILESGKWALLGGFMNLHETLGQAAKREVMEESGWEIGELTLLRINDNPDRPGEDRQNVDFIFFAPAKKQVSQSDEEVQELGWFDFAKVPVQKDWAFDHHDNFSLYLKHLRGEIVLPVLG